MDCRFVPAALGGLLCLTAVLVGCSPAYNWRDARPDGVPLRALLPCKPERADREVPLLGPGKPAVRLNMMSCDVGETTFALGVVQLPQDGQDAHLALRQWRSASWASLKQAPKKDDLPPDGWQRTPCEIAGASISECWAGPGLNHMGRPLVAQVKWLAKGPWLVQVGVYGEALPKAAQDMYFESLRFD